MGGGTKPDCGLSGKETALNASFEAIDRAVAGCAEADVLAARARGLMVGYHARWVGSGWQTVAVGPVFHLPIVNPATGWHSRTFTQAGRCDAVIERGGRRYLLKWKTVGEQIDSAKAPFWGRLAVDAQTGIYVLAQQEQAAPVRGVVYDVLRRPQIRPRQIPKGSAKRSEGGNRGTLLEVRKQGTYFGRPVAPGLCEAVLRGAGREVSELYAMRIAADALARPGRYFQRRTVRSSREQLAGHGAELWQTAVEIRLTGRAGRHYRNSDACMTYNTPCCFLPICSGRDAPDSVRWQPRRSIHPELDGALAGVDERGVLTYSRMQCFKLCRRKHYLRYELGIAPVKPPANATLRFSRVIGRALAAWWANQGAKQ